MMSNLIWIHDWINKRKAANPDWNIPENTQAFLDGIESDMASLSQQLGVDLSLYAIIPKKL